VERSSIASKNADRLFAHYRKIESLSEKTQEYENLLKDLVGVVDLGAAERIRSLLDKVCSSSRNTGVSLTIATTAWPGGGLLFA
jgi:hypothetical protein